MIERFDASPVLRKLVSGRDVLVKRSDLLPTVYVGSDIDVLSLNPSELLKSVYAEIYRSKGLSFSCKNVSPTHTHLDLFFMGDFKFRLDLYSAFPDYHFFEIRSWYLNLLISTSEDLVLTEDLSVPVPKPVDEALIRYLEYMNFYWTGPDKARHLDWILENLSSSERNVFMELLHRTVRQRNSESAFSDWEQLVRPKPNWRQKVRTKLRSFRVIRVVYLSFSGRRKKRIWVE